MVNYEPCVHKAERTISGSIILRFEGGNRIHIFSYLPFFVTGASSLFITFIKKETALQR